MIARDSRERGRTEEETKRVFERDVRPMYEEFVAGGRGRAGVVVLNRGEINGSEMDRKVVEVVDRVVEMVLRRRRGTGGT